MPTPVSFPLFHVTDPSTGMPLVGGLVWSYQAGTSTPQDTWAAWSPSGGYTGKNTNPIVLDSDGNASIYIALPTKLIIEMSPPVGQTHGSVLFTLDHLEVAPYNSYVIIGDVVPPTPGANQLGLYCSGTTLYIIDSTGAITSPATAQSIQQQTFSAASGGGTGDAITATLTPPLTALVDKIRLWIWAPAANTTTTPTFAPDGLTPKIIVKGSNSPLMPGDIPGANAVMLVEYNSTLDKWVLVNPYTKQSSAIIQNRQAQNVAGGTATSGSWLIVPLNTEYEDANNIVDSTALPAFSLPAGTYTIRAECPCSHVLLFLTRLYNVTDAAVQVNVNSVAMYGTSEYSGQDENQTSVIIGTFTITATKQFRIEYKVTSTVATQGLGMPTNFGPEVYAQVIITRI